MLFIETLNKKRYFTKPNGDTVLDLTYSSVDMSGDNPTEVNIIMVAEDIAMRPDAIAKAVYGDDGKLDLLLKYNGISNPFSIQAGDVLVIPDPYMMASKIKLPVADDTSEYNEQISEFKYITEQSDNVRLELLKRKSSQRLPPNANQPGDTNIKYKDGKIVFGEDVTTVNKENCPETLTRAKVKERILNSQIFK
jgi:hypothetical protein